MEKADTSFNTGNAEGFRVSPNNHPTKAGDFACLRARVIAGGRLLDPNCKTLCSNQSAAASPAATPAATAASPAAATTPAVSPAAGKTVGCSCAAPPSAVSGGGVELAEFRLPNLCDKPAKPVSAVNITNVVPAAAPPVLATPVAAAPAAAAPAGSAAPAASAAPAVTATVAPAATPAATVASATVTATSTSCADSAQIPIYQVELLSRQVMRVVIPKGVFSDAKGFVDIHVATPYGVSSHLAIPLNCCAVSCPPKTPTASGFAWVAFPQEPVANVVYDDKGALTGFNLESPLPPSLVKDNNDIPNGLRLKKALFVARITWTSSTGQNVSNDTAPLQIGFDDKGQPLVPADKLSESILKALGNLQYGFGKDLNVTEISLSGYLAPGDGSADSVTALTNILKVKLAVSKGKGQP